MKLIACDQCDCVCGLNDDDRPCEEYSLHCPLCGQQLFHASNGKGYKEYGVVKLHGWEIIPPEEGTTDDPMKRVYRAKNPRTKQVFFSRSLHQLQNLIQLEHQGE